MKEAEVVGLLLLPPYQDPPEAVHPRVGPLHNPAAGAVAQKSLRLALALAAAGNMNRVLPAPQQGPGVPVVVTFVGTQVLRTATARSRSPRPHPLEGRLHQVLVMQIRRPDRHPHRSAGAICSEGSLGPRFGPIRRVGTRFFPPREEPWSWPRRWIASPT